MLGESLSCEPSVCYNFHKISYRIKVPAFFTPNYEAYANQVRTSRPKYCHSRFLRSFNLSFFKVCWISNTYYVNSTINVPKSEETRKSSEIKYYQWIPVSFLPCEIQSSFFFKMNQSKFAFHRKKQFILLIQALFLYFSGILKAFFFLKAFVIRPRRSWRPRHYRGSSFVQICRQIRQQVQNYGLHCTKHRPICEQSS